jgi:hypothetical protein
MKKIIIKCKEVTIKALTPVVSWSQALSFLPLEPGSVLNGNRAMMDVKVSY